MSKLEQTKKLFKEYGEEVTKRVNTILELEEPVILDFTDITNEYYEYYENELYWWANGVLETIEECANSNGVHVYMSGENRVKCKVSNPLIDTRVGDYDLLDYSYDYYVGTFAQYIRMEDGFGEKQFIDFVESWHSLKEGESIGDWDENDECWDYFIESFEEGLPEMKKELDEVIDGMRAVREYVESLSSKLETDWENFIEE